MRRIIFLALAVGVLAAASVWLVAPARAYVGQDPFVVRLHGPGGSVSCSDTVIITASVTDAQSAASVGQQFVFWSLTTEQSSKDAVKPARTTTADDGTTSVTVTFGAVSGKRTVQALVADYKHKINLTCNSGVVTSPTPKPRPTPTPTATAEAPTPAAPSASPSATATGPIDLVTPSPAVPTPAASESAVPTATGGESASPAATGGESASPAATGGESASPAATQDPGTTHDPDAGGGGIASAVVLVGGLAILGAAAGLLWFALRRRPGAGRPPRAR